MANHSPFLKITRIHAAVVLCIASCPSTWAQQTPTEITITDKLPARVSGFGDVPAQELPFSTTTITSATLQDIGAQRVSDALRLDASVTDSYNSPAYWDMLSVRGFTLDNRYNYRREGLPISAETMIPMDNKERIELLKGTSGIQAGTSSPGGLVNYVVKRAPTSAEQQIRNVTISYGQGDNRSVAADLGGRFGETAEFGYRFNLAHEDLNPYITNTKGNRNLVALAMDWRIKPGTTLDFEVEQSYREQIGVNAYSIWGNDTVASAKLPLPVDPRINFSRQPWSVPEVFDALTGSVRLRQSLDNGWLWTSQAGSQHLRTDDRLAYASGAGSYTIKHMFDAQGNYDLYDWRSENEHRYAEVLSTELSGTSTIGNLKNDLIFSLMRQRMLTHTSGSQRYDYIGSANVNTSLVDTTNGSPYTDSPTTNLSEYSSEFGIKDRVHLSEKTSAWLGLRYNQINRVSIKTDGTAPTHDERNITTPWIGLSQKLSAITTIYASYGEGIESAVVPNKPSDFSNPGQALPTLRSTQKEIGIKGHTTLTNWQVTWFDITRPAFSDSFDSVNQIYTRQTDGEAQHRGLELSGNTSSISQWNLGAGYTWIDAKRQNSSIDPAINGQRPINVPSYMLRATAQYRFTTVPSLRTSLRLSREGERNVTEYGDIKLPAWTTLDATAHYDTKVNNVASTWTLGINNLANKQYWRESPIQYGHYYLYPGAPRTLRASVQFRL
jgi:iron complex outermembrane receptor protein